jgi:hypothetical protein
MIGGQASGVAVFAFGMAAALLANGPGVAAGAFVGLAAYKPNLAFFPALVLGLRCVPAGLATLAVAGALGVWGGLAVGWDAWRSYLEVPFTPAGQQALGSPPWHKFHGLAASTPWTRNTVGRGACMVAGVLASGALAWRWRRSSRQDAAVQLSAWTLALALALLANPYVPIYDLALLLPLGVCHAESLRRADETYPLRWAYVWLLGGLFGPHLSQALATDTGWQPFAWLLLAFAVKEARRFARLTR